jgi:hypothetical protein
MNLQTFIQRHYSRATGESPIGHALAVAAGLALIVIATMLVNAVVWMPAGIVIGFAGLLVLMGGIWGHISNPLNLEDLADSMVKLTGAAIAMTFGLAVVAVVVGFVLTVLVSAVRWIAS